jgi:hypothetical protein
MEVYGEAITGHGEGVQITHEGYFQKLAAAAAGMGTGKFALSRDVASYCLIVCTKVTSPFACPILRIGTGAVLFISCLMLAGWNEYRSLQIIKALR